VVTKAGLTNLLEVVTKAGLIVVGLFFHFWIVLF
jgi:hypothetical protein